MSIPSSSSASQVPPRNLAPLNNNQAPQPQQALQAPNPNQGIQNPPIVFLPRLRMVRTSTNRIRSTPTSISSSIPTQE